MCSRTIVTSLAVLLAITGAVAAATINVPADQPTIQAAIDASVDGDTIQVAAGTYIETGQIAIGKNLVVFGAGASTTIIKPDIDYAAGWWTVSAGKSLILQGVTLDCAGKSVPTCIVNNGSGAIQECVFKDIRGADYIGIALDSFGNMNVAGCTFQNIERVGVRTTDSTCAISGNTYDGKGDSAPCLDYFLEIRRGCNVTIQNNTISNCTGTAYDGSGSCAIQAYSDWPTFAQTTVNISGNTISDCSMGIVIGTYDPTDNTIAVLRNNNLAAIEPAVESGSTVQVDAESNWWGQSTGPTAEQIVTSGTSWGSPWSGSVDSTPWLTEPAITKPVGDNVVYLVPTAESIYVKLTDTVIVDMNVANLIQPVLGLQAMLKFSSTYFLSGAGDVSVVAGGGVWDELIYNMWNEGGDLDVAVGVHLGLTAGTQADAKTAIITLKPHADGVTKVTFRADVSGDDTKQTFFTDTAGNAVMPGAKLDTVDIYIDGTAPEITTCPAPRDISADAACQALVPDLTGEVVATDATSGVDSITQNPTAGTSIGLGVTHVMITVKDKLGNEATCTVDITVKDTTAPAITSATASPTCVKDQSVTIEAAATDNCSESITWEYKVGSGDWEPGPIVAASELAEGDNTLYVRAKDDADNWSDAYTVTPAVSKDTTAPTIDSISAVEGGTDVLDCAATATQGDVTITVEVSDSGCAALEPPSVVLANWPNEVTLTTTDTESPFTYAWTVDAATANGTWTVTVTAADSLDNSVADSTKAICVNKNQAAGTVSFSTLSSAAFSFNRDVVFVATDNAPSNNVLKTWTVSVAFTNSTESQMASGAYTLTSVPAGTAHLSAKTAWHLRKRVDVDLGGSGQITPGFTLLGGDLNGSNSINILDYSKMQINWGGGTGGDINGDGSTFTLDYSIMKSNWFRIGDPQ
jgi:hypothetical protein